MPLEEDDPVIASYDVFISPPPVSSTSSEAGKSSGLYMLQYPSHRPSNKPYNTSRSQKPSFVRLRPNTGIIELDVPIMTSDNYNVPLGSQFGKAMHESYLAHPNSTHGLSGGFSHNQNSNMNPTNLTDVPQHGIIDTNLQVQTLGGKISTTTDKDPIYMLATLKRNTRELHLQHLDAVVQLRPQLHHIDAAEEIKKRVESIATRAKTAAATAADPAAPVKLETKAIELKLKDNSKDDPKDRHQNENAKLLREIQNDPWVRYEWIETRGDDRGMIPGNVTDMNGDTQPPARLKASLDNDEWLNKMSSPGIELRTRLKGRDRERARRKRQERARAARGEIAAAAALREQEMTAGTASESSASDDDIDDDDEDMDDDEQLAADNDDAGFTIDEPSSTTATVKKRLSGSGTVQDGASSPEVQIKQEVSAPIPSSIPASSAGASTSTAVAASPATPKRRGRPPKNKAG